MTCINRVGHNLPQALCKYVLVYFLGENISHIPLCSPVALAELVDVRSFLMNRWLYLLLKQPLTDANFIWFKSQCTRMAMQRPRLAMVGLKKQNKKETIKFDCSSSEFFLMYMYSMHIQALLMLIVILIRWVF